MLNNILLKKMRAEGRTVGECAQEIGIFRQSVYRKINGQTAWTVPEAIKICKYLHIPVSQIHKYFISEVDK